MLALWHLEAGKVEEFMKMIISRLQRQKAGVFMENCFHTGNYSILKTQGKKSRWDCLLRTLFWQETTKMQFAKVLLPLCDPISTCKIAALCQRDNPPFPFQGQTAFKCISDLNWLACQVRLALHSYRTAKCMGFGFLNAVKRLQRILSGLPYPGPSDNGWPARRGPFTIPEALSPQHSRESCVACQR